MSDYEPDLKEDVVTNIDEEVTEPPMFKVLIHNDNYTTKEFVVKILVSVFSKSLEEATHLMWVVHKNGVGVCGVGCGGWWVLGGAGDKFPSPNFQISVVVRSPRPTEIELHIEHVTACRQTDQSQSADDPDHQS